MTDTLNGALSALCHKDLGIPRWYDEVYNRQDSKRKQTKTADDIVEDFVNRGGLVIKHEST